jgi:hypothetical protein
MFLDAQARLKWNVHSRSTVYTALIDSSSRYRWPVDGGCRNVTVSACAGDPPELPIQAIPGQIVSYHFASFRFVVDSLSLGHVP